VVARAYCDLIDSLGRGGPEGRDLFLRLEVLLADLHAAAVRLPMTDMESDEDEVDAGVSHEAWEEDRQADRSGDRGHRFSSWLNYFEKLE
jgi:hypothetical protein